MTAAWNDKLAGVIGAIGSPEFHERMGATLRHLVDFDYTVIFAYYRDVPPIDVYDDFPARKRKIFVTRYQEGPYLLDPFFLATLQDHQPNLYRLKELAPDRFYQSEYFRSYYIQTGLSEEIGYFVPLPEGVTMVVSLMRSEHDSTFSAHDFRKLKEVAPLVNALIQQQHHDLFQQFSEYQGADGRSNIQRYIDHAFDTFGRNVLTPRERDVVEYVLKGNSSAAIGRLLEISPGTVQIHRKNIYAKLGINSQGELFSQFIKGLTRYPETLPAASAKKPESRSSRGSNRR